MERKRSILKILVCAWLEDTQETLPIIKILENGQNQTLMIVNTLDDGQNETKTIVGTLNVGQNETLMIVNTLENGQNETSSAHSRMHYAVVTHVRLCECSRAYNLHGHHYAYELLDQSLHSMCTARLFPREKVHLFSALSLLCTNEPCYPDVIIFRVQQGVCSRGGGLCKTLIT